MASQCGGVSCGINVCSVFWRRGGNVIMAAITNVSVRQQPVLGRRRGSAYVNDKREHGRNNNNDSWVADQLTEA
jgi:hypothetical protein